MRDVGRGGEFKQLRRGGGGGGLNRRGWGFRKWVVGGRRSLGMVLATSPGLTERTGLLTV